MIRSSELQPGMKLRHRPTGAVVTLDCRKDPEAKSDLPFHPGWWLAGSDGGLADFVIDAADTDWELADRANDTADAFGIGATLWPGLAKLMEEAGEVVQVCAKLIATGGCTAHWSGDDLRERLSEEMGDLWAALEYVHAHNLIPGVMQRRGEKFVLFQEWDGRARRAGGSSVSSDNDATASEGGGS